MIKPLARGALGVLLAFAVPQRATLAQNQWWPASGSVILGGGGLSQPTFDRIARQLITLAGGPDSLIVVIPTANEGVAPRIRGSGPPVDTNRFKTALEAAGAKHVAIVHTRSRTVADGEELAKLLHDARGVWIPGGGARILENTYRGTRVARELTALLDRGGVIFGDSAGSIALGCYAMGWTPTPWGIVVTGLSVLPFATIIPHASAARGYVPIDEALKYLVSHPGPTGVIIDENTALVVSNGVAQVIGSGAVSLIDPARNKQAPYAVLHEGLASKLGPAK
jgi:cyanophycinase